MLCTLYGRIDRVLAFIQILLGSAALASAGSPTLIGAAVAFISAYMFVWQPAKSALLCDLQAKKMKALMGTYENLDDDDFHRKYLEAQEADSPNIGSLRDAALKRAYIVLGRSDDARAIKLSRYQSLLSIAAGDFPRDD